MTKSNGIASLKQAAKLLNRHAPDGESLAYINPEEARVLKSRGGSGIQTLSTVPSYIDWGNLLDLGKKYIPSALDFGQKALDLFSMTKAHGGENDQRSTGTEYMDPFYQKQSIGKLPFNPSYPNIHAGENVPTENPFWKDIGSSIIQSGKEFLKGRYGGEDAIKNIGKDAMSVWMALRAKKDQEGLNNAEMEQFNKLNQQMAEYTEEFKANIAGGGVENVPTDVTDVASFTDVTLPDMTTTAVAEGGRIGYNEGSGKTYENWLDYRIKVIANGELPVPFELWKKGKIDMAQGGRIGYNLGGIDRPFQGIGALNRMGYQEGTHPLDGVAMQMFGMTFENLNPLQQIVVTQSQDKAGGSNIEEMLNIGVTDENTNPQEVEQLLKGLRVGAQKGGIMPLLNMGGMEKDYRQDGGFVPIGRKEKADDVPARLSKNEFVFTADAVRAAGGGDIDQGAQRMYNVMKNLEAGGEISEQSQGQV